MPDRDVIARGAAGFSPSRLATLRTVLQGDVDAASIPGAVTLVARHGEVAFLEAFGYSNRASSTPMQVDCRFRIASMTKPVTVVAALMLMERGRLLLTDPASRFLPELAQVQVGVEQPGATGQRQLTFEPAKRAMTIQDLMRHTAGFTYGQFGDSLVQRAYRAGHLIDDQQTNADMLTKLSTLPLAYQPGSTFEYGMSTDVLGRIVEVVAGMELNQFFLDEITGPLAMPHTGFGIKSDEASLLAEPQREQSSSAPPAVVPYDPARPAKWFSGGSGLLSTAADYARFCQMLLNGGELDGVRLLSRKSIELMRQNHLPHGIAFGPRTADLGIAAPLPALGQGYGLGLGVRCEPGLSPVPGSVGDYYWGGALGPYFWIDPVEQLVVVFMLQELNVARRTRYRALLRSLVYQALL